MKQPPIDTTRKFKPSAISAPGFLGTVQSDIDEIISSDRKTIEEKGTTLELIAAQLEEFYNKAARAMGDIEDLGFNLKGEMFESRGKLPCPFGACGFFPKGQVVISGPCLTEPFIITPLSIHLIRTHGFFQGTGTLFRIDPATVVRCCFAK